MPIMSVDQFANQIEAFLTRSGMPATNFGREAINDPNFVFQLRRGRAPSLRLVEIAQRFIQKQDQLAKSRRNRRRPKVRKNGHDTPASP
jgi:2,4-dienoyl-CoA reductase-like NADH-dependent reductase (Old Yellow Enzyme family)